MSVLVEPSSRIPLVKLLQFTDMIPLVFCCNVKPVQGEGQDTATVLVVVSRILSNGSLNVWTIILS